MACFQLTIERRRKLSAIVILIRAAALALDRRDRFRAQPSFASELRFFILGLVYEACAVVVKSVAHTLIVVVGGMIIVIIIF
jgi:hypothetical protein